MVNISITMFKYSENVPYYYPHHNPPKIIKIISSPFNKTKHCNDYI